MRTRQKAIGTVIAGGTAAALALTACGPKSGGTSAASSKQGTLIIGMTAADLPSADTVLASGQGYEGYRFVGNSLYDGLTKYDLKQSSQIPAIIGGLATSW